MDIMHRRVPTNLPSPFNLPGLSSTKITSESELLTSNNCPGNASCCTKDMPQSSAAIVLKKKSRQLRTKGELRKSPTMTTQPCFCPPCSALPNRRCEFLLELNYSNTMHLSAAAATVFQTSKLECNVIPSLGQGIGS